VSVETDVDVMWKAARQSTAPWIFGDHVERHGASPPVVHGSSATSKLPGNNNLQHSEPCSPRLNIAYYDYEY